MSTDQLIMISVPSNRLDSPAFHENWSLFTEQSWSAFFSILPLEMAAATMEHFGD